MSEPGRLRRAVRRFRVSRYWGRAAQAGGIATWAAEPVARRAINRRVSGSPDVWPLEWFARDFADRPYRRALSLGCGDGPLERDLVCKGLCESVLGLDLAAGALELARQRAVGAGLEGIEYAEADLDRLTLDETYDAVFAHQSLHHVRALESCLDEVERALAPGGLLYLDEYVGPSRGDWRRELLAEADALYASLPRSVRRRRRLELPIDRRDPSEGIRAAEIVPQVAARFAIETRRDYGGNLLAVIYPHLRFDDLEPPARDELLERLLEREDELLAAGQASFYTVIVASRKDGERRPVSHPEVEKRLSS